MPVNPADVRIMAERYTAAWCSHDPESVASFYTEEGSITINHGQRVCPSACPRKALNLKTVVGVNDQ